MRAKRIIDNHVEHKIYYEDAWLELYGWPVAYTPYFSAPDPSVRRASGFLAPHFYGGSNVGYGVGIPYFWALAPDYDVTHHAEFSLRAGFPRRCRVASAPGHRHLFDQAQWNHTRRDPEYFRRSRPMARVTRRFRGSIESKGQFFFNENWKYGWDVAGATDKYFFHDYKIRSPNITYWDFANFREANSTVYLTGKADRSWFDLHGFYFESLNGLDFQKQIPVAAPVLDYDRRFDAPSFLGGEITVNANMENIHRQAGDFVDTAFRNMPINPAMPGVVSTNYLNTFLINTLNTPGSPYGNVYDACAIYSKPDCLVRGIPGDYARASVDLSWRRRIIDDYGEVWTPFAYFKGQASFTDLNTSGFNNIQIANFLSPDQSFGVRAMPAIGLEYRFPFVATSDWGTSVIEPIAEVIARPNESRIGHLPNEDAQSLVFDDTTLFQWDKFSGYDRMEGGTRANAGLQYTFTTKSGAFANFLFGESYALAGANSFAVGDLTNTGPRIGLEHQALGFCRPDPSAAGLLVHDDGARALRRSELRGEPARDPEQLLATPGGRLVRGQQSGEEPVLLRRLWADPGPAAARPALPARGAQPRNELQSFPGLDLQLLDRLRPLEPSRADARDLERRQHRSLLARLVRARSECPDRAVQE